MPWTVEDGVTNPARPVHWRTGGEPPFTQPRGFCARSATSSGHRPHLAGNANRCIRGGAGRSIARVFRAGICGDDFSGRPRFLWNGQATQFSVTPVLVTGIQPPRVCAVKELQSVKEESLRHGHGALDSCDKHRNDGETWDACISTSSESPAK